MSSLRHVIGFALAAAISLSSVAAPANAASPIDAIQNEAFVVRGLKPKREIKVAFITRAEAAERTVKQMDTWYSEEAQTRDESWMKPLGIIKPHEDMGPIRKKMYSGIAAGFYDPTSNELFIVSKDRGASLTHDEKVTIFHETIHALQDQHLGLDQFHGAEKDMTLDRQSANQSVYEGDAVTSQEMFIGNHPDIAREIDSGTPEPNATFEPVYPPFDEMRFGFPYVKGVEFVHHQYETHGGWKAVNSLFQNPPTTTEQVLHPEKYAAKEDAIAVTVQDPSRALGGSWRTVQVNTHGELNVMLIIDPYYLDNAYVERAASGWGGDQFVTVTNGAQFGYVWGTTWDTDKDAQEFYDAMVKRESERFTGVSVSNANGSFSYSTKGFAGNMVRSGKNVTYIIAPDDATLKTMVNAQKGTDHPAQRILPTRATPAVSTPTSSPAATPVARMRPTTSATG